MSGSAIQTHALPIAAVVALSFAFLPLTEEPEVEKQFETQTAQVSTTTS